MTGTELRFLDLNQSVPVLRVLGFDEMGTIGPKSFATQLVGHNMSYKSLFCVLTDVALADDMLGHAVYLAAIHDAHLEVLCLGVDHSQTGYYQGASSVVVLQETITQAHEDAHVIETHVRNYLRSADIRWGVESAVAQLAGLNQFVAARARFADLVILPLPYGENCGAELEPITEAALFEGQATTLILPQDIATFSDPKRIMICWNESPEALSAIRAAMPILQAAEAVHVAVIDPPAHGPTRSDPGGLLSQYLSRHGVRTEIDVLSRTLPRVADVIVRHATDMDAELIVMGAYGHSRFREAIFGGATRNMLEHSVLPLMMAHS